LGHKSFSGAGETVQREHIGASHVPLFRSGMRQSHSSVAHAPHLQRLRRAHGPQTMPVTPPMLTRSHVIA
jgi:hypothetical protein